MNRRPGVILTYETRAEANEQVDRQRRYRQILEIMTELDKPMSAKEIAIEMKKRGYTPTSERNFVSPRITELMKAGKVEFVEKGLCRYSNRNVCKFAIRKEVKNEDRTLCDTKEC